MSTRTVTDQIKHYQKDIDDYRSGDSTRVLRCLKKLYELPVTVPHLEKTRIGKSVNSLKKCGGEVGEAAKAIVSKWMAMVAEEEDLKRKLEEESFDRKSIAVKNHKKHSTHSDSDKNSSDKIYIHDGRENRLKGGSSSDRHSNSDKRLKFNELSNYKSENISNDTGYKHHSHDKPKSDRDSNDRGSSKNTLQSSDKHCIRKDKHYTDVKNKKETNDKNHNSSKSSKSIDKDHRKGKRNHSNDSVNDKDIKRRRLKSPSPTPSYGSYENDNTNIESDNNDNDHIDELERIEERVSSESEEDERVESMEEDEGEDDSEEEVRPNPYLNTFIKSEPESSDNEVEGLLDGVDIDELNAGHEDSNESFPESNADSKISEENSEEEEMEEEKDYSQNHDNRRSRLSSESASDEEATSRKSIQSHKRSNTSSSCSRSSEKSSFKDINKHHERQKYKESEVKSSLKDKNKQYSHKLDSVSDSKGSGSISSNNNSKYLSNSSKHHSSSKGKSSSSSSGHSSSHISSSHSKTKEHSKVTSNDKKSSHLLNGNEVKYSKDSDASKENKSIKSSESDKSRNSSSSSKHHTLPVESKSSSSSSSTKDKKYKSESQKLDYSDKNRSSSSKKSESTYIKKESVKNDSLLKVIKKEPIESVSGSHKTSSSKSLKSEKNMKHKEDNPEKISKLERVKIKTEKFSDNEDGIDCGSGASFADALGMSVPTKKIAKKKSTSSGSLSPQKSKVSSPSSSSGNKQHCHSEIKKQSKSQSSSNDKVNSKPELLVKHIKLEPLEMDIDSTLPEITPNYHPLPHYSPTESNSWKKAKSLTEEEALSTIMSTKNQRTKVFSGNKVSGGGSVPSLYSLCSHVILENIDALEYTGGVPYDLLKPVLERLTAAQLYSVEHYNPYLVEDTDVHWKYHCGKDFRGKQREEMESWRDLYLRCFDEREQRLKALTANINQNTAQRNEPVRKTKLAYVDSFVKPPRGIAKKQAKFGTASGSSISNSKHEIVAKAIVGANSGSPTKTVVPLPPAPSRSHQTLMKKKKPAPLMLKTMQFMKSNRYK